MSNGLPKGMPAKPGQSITVLCNAGYDTVCILLWSCNLHLLARGDAQRWQTMPGNNLSQLSVRCIVKGAMPGRLYMEPQS